MLNLENRDLKRVLKKAEELKELSNKQFSDLTVSELSHLFSKTQVLIDYIFNLKEGLEMQEQETGE